LPCRRTSLPLVPYTTLFRSQSAQEFVEKFRDHKNKHVLIYGDPAGRAGERHGHKSDYTEIEDVLRQNGWQFTRKVKKAAPAIKEDRKSTRLNSSHVSISYAV